MSTTEAAVAARKELTEKLVAKFPNLHVLPETSANVRPSIPLTNRAMLR